MVTAEGQYTQRYVYDEDGTRISAEFGYAEGTNPGEGGENPASDIAVNSVGKVWYRTNMLGSTLFAVDADGEVVSHTLYDPWGEPLADTETDMNRSGFDNCNNYTGYTWDEVLGLYFAQNRFYDAETHRFTQEDPAQDGSNWYAYCENNPTTNTDPWGLNADAAVLAFETTVTVTSLSSSAVFAAVASIPVAGWVLLGVVVITAVAVSAYQYSVKVQCRYDRNPYPQVPDIGKLNIPDMHIPRITVDIPDFDIPDLSDLYIPDLSDLNIPDLSDLNIPDFSDWSLPDFSDWSLPDLALDLPDSYFDEGLCDEANSSTLEIAKSLIDFASTAATPPPPNDPNSKGTQTTSTTLYNKNGVRIDVENPGNRLGQIHLQQGRAKYLYDIAGKCFKASSGELAPKAIQELLSEPRVIKAVGQGLRILGY